ncbi:MAG: hypothetical protein JWN67_972 [Actinomycetia bacterium]|nr:hypothetical protein [Actinomycetes bacterium]
MAGSILLLTGPPGAGKTTVAGLVARSFERAVHLKGDDFFHAIVSGYIPPWRPESQEQNEVVLDVTAGAARAYAVGGYQVVLDGIFGPWFLERFVGAALHHEVDIQYVVLRPDEDTCVARATARGGGELTDPEPVRKMYAELAHLGRYERHVLDTAGEDPATTATRVLDALSSGRCALIELIGGPEQVPIEVVDPDPAWTDRFTAERARIATALAGIDHRAEHVGSTSVAGLAAKPIIDIQLSVPDVDDDTWLAPLERAGYALRVREPGHWMVRTPERDVHVHVCSTGSAWERRHLLFRDWLRTCDEDRDRYGSIKRTLATREWPTRQHYTEAKSDVIRDITARAEAWAAETGWAL